MGSSISSTSTIPSDVLASELLKPADASDIIVVSNPENPALVSSNSASPAVLEIIRVRRLLRQYATTLPAPSPSPAPASTTSAADLSPPAPTRYVGGKNPDAFVPSPAAPARSAIAAAEGRVDGVEEYPEVLPDEPLMRISYKSTIVEECRHMSIIDTIVELAGKFLLT